MPFDGLNVRDHLLIDIRYEKDITYNEMERKNWRKMKLGNCEKTKVFLINIYGIFLPILLSKSKCVIFFKVTKIAIFSGKKKQTYVIQHGARGLCPRPKAPFF